MKCGAFIDNVKHNCHLPAPGRNIFFKCQQQLPLKEVTNIAIVSYIVLDSGCCRVYAVKQRVFRYKSHVKYFSARRCRRKFRSKFPGTTVRNPKDIHEHINKVNRFTGSFTDRKPDKKFRVLT